MKRPVLVVCGCLGAAALAFALVLTGGSKGRPAAATSPAPPTTVSDARPDPRGAAGPTTTRGGLPAGFTRNQAGASAAAMTYACASQRWLYLPDAEVERAVRAVATSAAAPRLIRDVLGEVRAAREALAASAGRIWWIVRPLAVKVESADEDRARVAVWTVSVLSASDVALPQSDWSTVTVDLVWEDGDWRVDAIDDARGPTPMVGPKDQPWQPEPFDEALDGFVRVDVGGGL